jgi:selenocysteine-specific elongation factor
VDAGLLLQGMVEAGELVAGEGGYAPAGAGVLGDEQAALAEQILVRLGADPLAPPTLALLAEELRRPARELAQILDVLVRRGETVRVDKDLWFTSGAVDGARDVLLAQLESAGEVTIAGFRDAAGCGRRNAQALLEYFDREGLTLRRGDVRVARRRRS